MQRSIVHVDVHRTALIVALAVAVVGLVVAFLAVPFFFMAALWTGGGYVPELGLGMAFPAAMLLIAPLVHLVTAYIFTAIAVLVFNLVAPRVGGLRVRFAEAAPDAA
jgi:hypothetical protein